jgi:two-component system, LytTR family, sensor kinase
MIEEPTPRGNSAPALPEDQSRAPRVTRQGILIVLAAWGVYSALAALPLAASQRVSFLTALGWQMYQSVAMCALSLPVWWVVISRMHASAWYWKGFAHLVLAPAYAGASYGVLYGSMVLFAGASKAGAIRQASDWVLYLYLTLYGLQFALYHGYDVLRKLRAREHLTLELLALRREQELVTLKGQMNPHFLFNALNSISAMVTVDAEETRTMIAQLAAMLRYAIDSARKESVPLRDELQFVQDYVALEARRMGERLTSTIDVDPSLNTYQVPPMVLQPLVENAIRHGLAPAEDGGSLAVRITRNHGGVAFLVSDTGVGLQCANPMADATGIGLKNTDARLRKLFGEAAALTIRPGPNGGCEVSFTLPGQ